ncbi:MAG: hypothetical protein ACYCW6_19970 [Candidatus Xenobia bacterium]
MMNVNMSPQSTAQIARAAQNVGFLPEMAPKDVKKEETRSTNFIDEMKKDETENTTKQAGSENAAMGQASNEATAKNAGNRRISKNNMFGHQREEYTTGEKQQGGGTQKTGQQQANQDGSQAEDGSNKPRFDTGRQIQLQYSNQAGRTPSQANYQNPAEQALAQKERFLRSFKSLVENEYNQYVKSDDALYSRKNLREILAALGDQDSLFSRKDTKTKKDDKNNLGSLKGYNKLNQRLAGRTLHIFDEPPQNQQDQPREPLSLVA